MRRFFKRYCAGVEPPETRLPGPDVVAYTVAVAACGQSLRWRHVLSLLQESLGRTWNGGCGEVEWLFTYL